MQRPDNKVSVHCSPWMDGLAVYISAARPSSRVLEDHNCFAYAQLSHWITECVWRPELTCSQQKFTRSRMAIHTHRNRCLRGRSRVMGVYCLHCVRVYTVVCCSIKGGRKNLWRNCQYEQLHEGTSFVSQPITSLSTILIHRLLSKSLIFQKQLQTLIHIFMQHIVWMHECVHVHVMGKPVWLLNDYRQASDALLCMS